MIKEWLDFIVTIVFTSAALICVYESTKILRSSGPSKGAFGLLAIGLLYFIGICAFSLLGHKSTQTAIKLFTETRISREPFAAPVLTDENRDRIEDATKLRASLIFVDSGKLVEYIDRSGKRALFSPTQVNIQDREQHVITLTRLEQMSEDTLKKTFTWALFPIIMMSLGYFSGIRRNKNQ